MDNSLWIILRRNKLQEKLIWWKQTFCPLSMLKKKKMELKAAKWNSNKSIKKFKNSRRKNIYRVESCFSSQRENPKRRKKKNQLIYKVLTRRGLIYFNSPMNKRKWLNYWLIMNKWKPTLMIWWKISNKQTVIKRKS